MLSAYGARHLRETAPAVADGKKTLIIEPSGDAAIDEARRIRIVDELAALHVNHPATAVVIATPAAPGTTGEESANVDADTPRGGQTNNNSGSQNSNSSNLGNSSGSQIGSRAGGF